MAGDGPGGGRPVSGRPVQPPGPEARRVLSRLELVVNRRLRGLVQGEHLGLFPGAGSEPGESRPYVPGDDVRLIDWNVTARTGALVFFTNRRRRRTYRATPRRGGGGR